MDPEFYEYLSEYRLQSNNEPISHYEGKNIFFFLEIFTKNKIFFPSQQFLEGELEAEWLVSAGFPELTKPFEHVRNFDVFFANFIFIVLMVFRVRNCNQRHWNQ